MTMKKVLLIENCKECKYSNCKLRVLDKNIPKNCPLSDLWIRKNVYIETDITDNVIECEYFKKDILGLE